MDACEFQDELQQRLFEGGSIGLALFQWPDSFEAELYVDTPAFYRLTISRGMRTWLEGENRN